MGLMKNFLIEKVEEFAVKEGLDSREVYNSSELYGKACDYADQELRKITTREMGKDIEAEMNEIRREH